MRRITICSSTRVDHPFSLYPDRISSEARQKQRQAEKRERAEAERRAAEARVRAQQELTQKLRSEAFAAARRGDEEGVRRLVWDEDVNVTGGEFLVGRGSDGDKLQNDDLETLLHIAANQGKLELVEWLLKRSEDQFFFLLSCA